MSDRRRYIRIRTVFPVLISPVWDRDPVVSLKRYQGFTKDISQHGLCVEVNELGDLNPIFFQKGLELKIDIEVPFRQKALSGRAHIIWLNQDSGSLGVRYLLGVQWIDNINSDHRLLFQFAKRSRRHPYFIWGTITILVITLVIYYAHYQSLWLSMLRKDFQFARLQSSFIQLCKERDQLRTVRIS
ncbi:MAG: PilZ domain-containing protein, partial [Candidatus Aureabacteria bacterium]|nr:PilZ domain-containing protein [Candidatus Auribacterota bacterium]